VFLLSILECLPELLQILKKSRKEEQGLREIKIQTSIYIIIHERLNFSFKNFLIKLKLMKKYFFLTFIIALILGFIFFDYFIPNDEKNISSPLPEELMENKNSQVSSLDFWLPSLFGFFNLDSDTGIPILTAKSALVYDLKDEKVLYEKNPELVTPMASLTKLMTAIVAIDNAKEDDRYTVTPEALVGENTIGLSEGEVMSLEELLYGVFMYSANDAAETLAINTMKRDEFIKAMNEKGKAIGLKNTNFTNPTGLQGDGNQHTTAYDLLVLSKYALENYPEIRNAAATPEHYLPATEDHYEYYLYSQLNLLTTYPGVKGLKDGYTPEAGWCLITYYKNEDEELIGIVLGSEDRRGEMQTLLDYSLTQLGITPPPHS
jgi:D-alanyl-D-alanine carboxypeptidase